MCVGVLCFEEAEEESESEEKEEEETESEEEEEEEEETESEPEEIYLQRCSSCKRSYPEEAFPLNMLTCTICLNDKRGKYGLTTTQCVAQISVTLDKLLRRPMTDISGKKTKEICQSILCRLNEFHASIGYD